MKHLLAPLAFITAVNLYAAEPNDSTKVRELEEVVVEAAGQTTSKSKSTYIPAKRQKQASIDPIDLLARMQIPELNVDPVSGSIKDYMQKEVPVFIDGHKATQEELTGMRMTDILRVEYLVNPSDPSFLNEPVVVNFIMKKYEWGGYTKITELANWLPYTPQNREGIHIFSRYVKKRNTLDAWGSANTYYEQHFGTYENQTFNLENQTVVREQIPGKSRKNENKYNVGLEHTYATDKGLWFQHYAMLNYVSVPLNTSRGEVLFSSSDFVSANYRIKSPEQGINPIYHAGLTLPMPHGWSLHSEIDFNYSHKRADYNYLAADFTDIVNDTKSDMYRLGLYAIFSKQFDNRHTLNFSATGILNWQTFKYAGANPMDLNVDQHRMDIIARYQYSVQKLLFWVEGGLDCQWRMASGSFYRVILPSAKITARYSFNNRNTLQINGSYSSSGPSEKFLNAHMTQENELFYTIGNPNLKNWNDFNVSAQYTWLPSNNLNCALFAICNWQNNRFMPSYTLLPDNKGVLMEYITEGHHEVTQAGLSVTYRLLGGKLGLNATPTLYAMRWHGIYHGSSSNVWARFSAYYYLGNFNFSATYNTPMEYCTNVGTKFKFKPSYSVSAGWSNGKWALNLSVRNPFSRNWKRSTAEFFSPIYSYAQTNYGQNSHSHIGLKATYTFGYGKQVSHQNERTPD